MISKKEKDQRSGRETKGQAEAGVQEKDNGSEEQRSRNEFTKCLDECPQVLSD